MGGLYTEGAEGNALTSITFEHFLGPIGSIIVAIGLLLFAYSTILGWSYYGEKCFTYLFSESIVKYYRYAFVVAVFIGSVTTIDIVWGIADVMNGLMALPNLIGLLGLSGVVVAETKKFLDVVKEEKKQKREGSTS